MHNSILTDDYALYNDDCMAVLPQLPTASIDHVVYSPPFAGLYQYSSDPRDMSNCASRDEFLEHYEFLVRELARVTKPGRINAVHCTDVISDGGRRLWDFPNEIIRIHERHGFAYRNRITIWKEPLKVRMRTMVRSLMHKLIVEDASECFTAMPDYVLVFKRDGTSEVPVQHAAGLSHYFGSTPLLPALEKTYGSWEGLLAKYANWEDPRTNKLSHIIWQRYASSVWDDIRIDEVLPFREARDEEDEKHVHPLQLDVIDRLVYLYTNPGETVLSPFSGVGSEPYSAVSLGRKAIGVEIKPTYFSQGSRNMSAAKSRFASIGLFGSTIQS